MVPRLERSILVLGPEDGQRLAEREGIAAFFVTRTNSGYESWATTAFRDRPDIPTQPDLSYHAVFEVRLAPDDVGALNRRIETVARYLNMHAQAGVPNENVHAALVIHGPAGRALLSHDAYRKKYGVDNPDRDLTAALAEAGVDIVMCGQTAMSRGFYPELLVPEAKVALSAMTALVRYQADGYGLIAF